MSDFFSDKIILELSNEGVSIETIPFPAITICPQIFHDNAVTEQPFMPSDERWT